MAMIVDATLCTECIAKKIDAPIDRVEPILVRIAAVLRVQSADARCDACLTVKKVFRLA